MPRQFVFCSAIAAIVAMVHMLAPAKADHLCPCSFEAGRQCTAAFLVSEAPVEVCRESQVPCGPCFCDPNGPLTCETVVVVGYTMTNPDTKECSSDEIRIATCPAESTPVPTAAPVPTASPAPTPTIIPVDELPTPRPVLTQMPAPTLTPGNFVEVGTFCSIEARVPWVNPLRCTISADSVPPNAIIQGAVARINQGANGTATLLNEKPFVANGTYQAIILNMIEPAEYWDDWADIRTNLRRAVLQPFSSSEEIARRPRFDTYLYSTPAFVPYAQNRLVTQRLDVQVTFHTDKMLAIGNAFSGGRVDGAWSFADVEIIVYFTLG